MFENEKLATMAGIAQLAFSEGIKNLHTSTPGIVVSFDPVTQLASVQPAIKRVFKTKGEDEDLLVPRDLPILINVPVIFPRGGGFSITFPVKPGDECLLTFCERAIDGWHQFGTVREPTARRFHDLSDAVAFVGLSSLANKIANYDPNNLVFKADDDRVKITILPDGTTNIFADTEITLDSPLVTITNDLNVVGETSLSDTVTSNGKDISDTHTHTGSPTAPTGAISDTGVPL